MSSHKPRRSRRRDDVALSRSSGSSVHGLLTIDPITKEQRPSFALVAFLYPAKGTTSRWVALPVILIAVGLFRWCTGFWGYSGFRSPPMHGDFEAQRHWMEVTAHLPVSQWYWYDLEWWGLDYPPLTAYHSWMLGKLGSLINPSWFALDDSRRLDDAHLKVYMRVTVLLSEYFVYIPALVVFLDRYSLLQNVSQWESWVALAAILMQPATILIDHAHFQYNTVMLGLLLASLSNLLAERFGWASVFFVASIGFKQMGLYFAPAIFAYLLGTCTFPTPNPVRFLGIAVTTVGSFALLFAPFFLGIAYDMYRGIPQPFGEPPLLSMFPFRLDPTAFYYPFVAQFAQAIHRIFPFSRGIFEDKVANLWCILHSTGIHKLNRYATVHLQRASLAATATAITTPCTILFFKPRKQLLPYGFAACAWGFFLCSFQVHEKSVLLPLLPMTLLLASKHGMMPENRAWIGFANILGCWTMFPLLKRDQLRVPYTVLTLLWSWLLGLPPISFSAYLGKDEKGALDLGSKVVHLGFHLLMLAWHFIEAFVQPPSGKPDLWVVLNVTIGGAGFGLCYLWCLWRLLRRSELGQGLSKEPEEKTRKTS